MCAPTHMLPSPKGSGSLKRTPLLSCHAALCGCLHTRSMPLPARICCHLLNLSWNSKSSIRVTPPNLTAIRSCNARAQIKLRRPTLAQHSFNTKEATSSATWLPSMLLKLKGRNPSLSICSCNSATSPAHHHGLGKLNMFAKPRALNIKGSTIQSNRWFRR